MSYIQSNIGNFLNKVDNLITSIPYQVYIGFSFMALFAVGATIYDYNNQQDPLNFNFTVEEVEQPTPQEISSFIFYIEAPPIYRIAYPEEFDSYEKYLESRRNK